MPTTTPQHEPIVLIIRDGWGENPNPDHDSFNAVKRARTPIADRLGRDWPTTLIHTSGEDVGLPAGTMGNSEVGHQNIGAGRVVLQEIMRISKSIEDGSFFENPHLVKAFEHAEQTGGSVHLLGLVSDGQVHSDIQHLFALIDLAAKRDFPGERLFIHAITDGRDVGPTTGRGFIESLQNKLDDTGRGRIATVMGRYYAMDRDHRWNRTALAYQALTNRAVKHDKIGDLPDLQRENNAVHAVQRYYDQPSSKTQNGDEFIAPTQIIDPKANQLIGSIDDGDSVIFFNFRGDRPRQITKAFVLDEQKWKNVQDGGFDRGNRIDDLYFCAMTNYEKGLPFSAIAFKKPPKMKGILGEKISQLGLTQFRCAETEKFAHVTFFFNDYREEPFEGEHRTLIDSPQDVRTYDEKPEMSAYAVCDAVLERLNDDDCEPLIVVNFANPDMVGHTGDLDAAIKAVETVDECVGRIVSATLHRRGGLVITADHGNADQMWNPDTNSPHTAHTTYDVLLHVVGEPWKNATLHDNGRLADMAPTLLAMLGLEQPEQMTGRSLIR